MASRKPYCWLLLAALAGSACSSDAASEPDEVTPRKDAQVDASKTRTPDASVGRRDAAVRDDEDDVLEEDVETDEPDASETDPPEGRPDAALPTPDASVPVLEKFSFFVTSLRGMQQLAKSDKGFGGDLRFGETGTGAGLRGADKICATLAEQSMPGAGSKVWHAFLSTVKGGASDGPVHAIDRIGSGPWYDRLGRVFSLTRAELLAVRPGGAHAAIKNDFPNEDGVPNHDPDGTGKVDNHDILTGSNDKGQLYRSDVKVTCDDWTKSKGETADAPRVGHSWPRGGNFAGTDNWMSALDEAGCGAGINLVEQGPPSELNPTVGSGGGYGGIYCFALTP